MLVKNGDAYIQMTLLKAAANLALDEAGKKYVEAEMTRQRRMKDFEEANKPGGGGIVGSWDDIKDWASGRGRGVTAIGNQVNEIKKEGDEFSEIAKKFQKDAAIIAKSLGSGVSGGGGTSAGGVTKGGTPTDPFKPNFKRDADIETTGREMKEYYEKLQKEQIKIVGDLISDPESSHSKPGPHPGIGPEDAPRCWRGCPSCCGKSAQNARRVPPSAEPLAPYWRTSRASWQLLHTTGRSLQSPSTCQ